VCPRDCLAVPARAIEDPDVTSGGAPTWYALCQATLCAAAGAAILSLWWRGAPLRVAEREPLERDPGLLWLGIGVAIWGVIGLELLVPWRGALALRTLLSSANSACLLISASHFDYGPRALQRAREWRGWTAAALGGSLAVALLTLALFATIGSGQRASQVPDFVLSIVTLQLYGFGLFRSFVKRGFGALAALAVVAVGLEVWAQLPEVLPGVAAGDTRWALNFVAKSVMLVAFLSLAMSWVHEVARRPAAGAMRLLFTGEARVGPAKRRRYVVRMGDEVIELRETPHRDLLALAVRRVAERDNPDGGWIPLPDLVGRLDDSRIRRLREDLRPAGLDRAIESNFQKSYRLALPPDRIAFDRAALAQDAELAPVLKLHSI
jgi:hypothetical protein